MPGRDIVVIGASAGGGGALRDLIARLPGDPPAAVLLVLHLGRTLSRLPEILQRSSRLAVTQAGMAIASRAGGSMWLHPIAISS